MISKYALSCKIYDEESSNWDESYIRKWLNTDFYNKAFSYKEKSIIIKNTLSSENPKYDTNLGEITKDKVFLLSVSEAKEYLGHLECRPSAYATTDIESEMDFECCMYWLRSSKEDSSLASVITENGDILEEGKTVDSRYIFVRPCIYLSIE